MDTATAIMAAGTATGVTGAMDGAIPLGATIRPGATITGIAIGVMATASAGIKWMKSGGVNVCDSLTLI